MQWVSPCILDAFISYTGQRRVSIFYWTPEQRCRADHLQLLCLCQAQPGPCRRLSAARLKQALPARPFASLHISRIRPSGPFLALQQHLVGSVGYCPEIPRSERPPKPACLLALTPRSGRPGISSTPVRSDRFRPGCGNLQGKESLWFPSFWEQKAILHVMQGLCKVWNRSEKSLSAAREKAWRKKWDVKDILLEQKMRCTKWHYLCICSFWSLF